MVITHGYAARLQADNVSVTMEDSSSRVRMCGGTGDQQRRICAVIGHATSFWTRRSLCADQPTGPRSSSGHDSRGAGHHSRAHTEPA